MDPNDIVASISLTLAIASVGANLVDITPLECDIRSKESRGFSDRFENLRRGDFGSSLLSDPDGSGEIHRQQERSG